LAIYLDGDVIRHNRTPEANVEDPVAFYTLVLSTFTGLSAIISIV
jgi:hypothetical protein